MISWAPTSSAAIDQGSQDAWIRSEADAVRAFGAPLFIRWFGEMEAPGNSPNAGTPAQFVAAWQRIYSIFQQEHATNAMWVWCPDASAFASGVAQSFYPGDAYVDWLCADAYNWFVCPNFNNPWTPLSTILSGQRTFALSHPNEEVWVPEFGSVTDPNDPTRRAQWMADAQALFKSPGWERYAGVLYFDINGTCQTKIDGDAQAVTAFAAMGADPYYAG